MSTIGWVIAVREQRPMSSTSPRLGTSMEVSTPAVLNPRSVGGGVTAPDDGLLFDERDVTRSTSRRFTASGGDVGPSTRIDRTRGTLVAGRRTPLVPTSSRSRSPRSGAVARARRARWLGARTDGQILGVLVGDAEVVVVHHAHLAGRGAGASDELSRTIRHRARLASHRDARDGTTSLAPRSSPARTTGTGRTSSTTRTGRSPTACAASPAIARAGRASASDSY